LSKVRDVGVEASFLRGPEHEGNFVSELKSGGANIVSGMVSEGAKLSICFNLIYFYFKTDVQKQCVASMNTAKPA